MSRRLVRTQSGRGPEAPAEGEGDLPAEGEGR